MKLLMMTLLIAFSVTTKAQSSFSSNDEVEELSYEDLVDRLSAKQRLNVSRQVDSPFDRIQIHGGVGIVNSFSTFRIQGKNEARFQNGMQLSAGVDLFSPKWMTEVAWRNFGLNRSGTEEHSLTELDLRVGYRDLIEGPWHYRLQSGLTQRNLRLIDEVQGYEITAQTPALLASAAAILKFSPNASLQIEAGGRAPVIDRTADKGSLDLMMELKISL